MYTVDYTLRFTFTENLLMRTYFILVAICAGLVGCCTDSDAQCSKNCQGTKKQNKSTSILKTSQMSPGNVAKPFACKLTTPELRKRKDEVIEILRKKVLEKKELDNGYSYKFSGEDEMFDAITSFVKSERQCCDFFDFKVSVTNDSFIWLEISGSNGVKEFIAAELEM